MMNSVDNFHGIETWKSSTFVNGWWNSYSLQVLGKDSKSSDL